MKYRKWLSEWLAVCVRPTTKARTYEKYERICTTHLVPQLGRYEMETLSASVLQGFVASMTVSLSPNTVNVIISVLKKSLKQAVLYGAAKRQHSNGIIRPKPEKKQAECFTKDEQRAIERYVLQSGNQKLVGILLCLYTGLRIGELMALSWDNIDFAEGLLTVTQSCHDSWDNGAYKKLIEPPKTKTSVRVIPLPNQILHILKKAKRDSSGRYVVGGDDPVSVRSYQRTFELLLKKLQIRHLGFHSLRHTFATRALECGMDVKSLSEILGHKSPTITLDLYVHSLLEHKRTMMNRLGKQLQ